MHKKEILFLFWILLMIPLCCKISYAQKQLQKEMEILKLFYPDKALIITCTREPKPVSKVAKNVTIITRKDIERMNAHNVADVLHRVAGIFINMFTQDMGSPGFIQIYGSEQRHVLIMIDGMPINFHSEGYGEVNSVPVDIVDRIEIIKGPASSSWGASIGGVINIITKKPAISKRPEGYVRFSYGERYTYDSGVQVSGTYNGVGYYLFLGKQGSDGMRNNRDFKRNSLFSKIRLPISDKLNAQICVGYSDPENDLGKHFHIAPPLRSYFKNHHYFLKTDFKAKLSDMLDINFTFYHIKQKANLNNKHIYTQLPYFELKDDEETYGGRLRLGIKKETHQANIGIDIERDDMDLTIDTGKILQTIGAAATSSFNPHREKWAIYANDTIDIGNLTVIPELRYDHDSTTGSFVSPSIGLAYRIGQHTILRGQFARGFSPPPLSWLYGGGIFLLPNRRLDHERILLYQIGAETSILKYIWLKGTAFRQEIDNYIIRQTVSPSILGRYINNGDMKKHGIELQFETLPIYGVKLLSSFSFVHFNPEVESGATNQRKYTLGIIYKAYGIEAELFGSYMWWNTSSNYNATYNHMIWDLNIKKSFSLKKTNGYIYMGIHNLLNGSQYSFIDRKNPRRWVEMGFRINF